MVKKIIFRLAWVSAPAISTFSAGSDVSKYYFQFRWSQRRG